MDVTKISQPDIEVLGIRIMEPVTAITDIIVAITCFYAYWKLTKENKPGKSSLYMRWYFFTMGLATFFGGMIGHGFLYLFNDYWKLLGWYTSMISVALIERSAIEYAKPYIKKNIGRFFLIVNIVELVTLMTITTITLHFRIVEFHCVYGLMFVVLSFHLFTYLKTKDVGSKTIIYAVGVLIVAAFVFNYPVVIHTWFNHRDLAHILMAIGTLGFLKGAQTLQQAQAT